MIKDQLKSQQALHVFCEIMNCGLERWIDKEIKCGWCPELRKFANWQLNSSSLASEGVACKFEAHISLAGGPLGYSLLADYTPQGKPVDSPDLVILYGAGIDSTVAIWYAQALGYKRVLALQVGYGAPYEEKEQRAALDLFENMSVPANLLYVKVTKKGLPAFDITEEKMGKGYIIPARNAMLASVGSWFGDNLWIVANYRKIDDGEGAATDKNRRFFAEISYLLSMCYNRPITVTSPFLHLTKAASIKWLQEYFEIHKGDYSGQDIALDILERTTTCYHPTEQRCSRCYSCAKLAMALEAVGVEIFERFFPQGLDDHMMKEFVLREHAKGRTIPKLWRHHIGLL